MPDRFQLFGIQSLKQKRRKIVHKITSCKIIQSQRFDLALLIQLRRLAELADA
jgi:hypothetical protein